MSFVKNSNNSNSIECAVCNKTVPPSFVTPGTDVSTATCSIRCAWALKGHCCQCGRGIPGNGFPRKATFCGVACADEARRGNWCCLCGVSQCAQGFTRCSAKCLSAANDSNGSSGSGNNNASASAATASPFPSRQTTPEDANSSKQHRTCCLVQPGNKIFERIVAPFAARGLQVVQVVQVNNLPQEKKAYAAHRLAVDQRMSHQGIPKFGMGGEGGEHKRFVPLMPGCWQSLQFAGNGNNGGANGQIPSNLCADPSCDTCRILGHGMKLSTLIGRSSHFSVPNFESVLPWCMDAGRSVDGGATRLCTVALTRVVIGVPMIVHELSQIQPPPVGYDCVLCMDPPVNGVPPETDSVFTYSDHSIQCEYIVSFVAPVVPQQQQQQAPALVAPAVEHHHNQYHHHHNSYQQQQQFMAHTGHFGSVPQQQQHFAVPDASSNGMMFNKHQQQQQHQQRHHHHDEADVLLEQSHKQQQF